MSRERKLRLAGYKFTGHYQDGFGGKDAMKAEAAKLRAQGLFATVLHKVHHGRVTSCDGYSVYSKPKKGQRHA